MLGCILPIWAVLHLLKNPLDDEERPALSNHSGGCALGASRTGMPANADSSRQKEKTLYNFARCEQSPRSDALHCTSGDDPKRSMSYLFGVIWNVQMESIPWDRDDKMVPTHFESNLLQ